MRLFFPTFSRPVFTLVQNSVFHDIPKVTEPSPQSPSTPPHPVLLAPPCAPAQSLGAYEGAIFALGVSGKWEKAVSLLDDIETRGLVPDEGVYAEVVVACGKVRNRARPNAAALLVLAKSGDVTVKRSTAPRCAQLGLAFFFYSERERRRDNVALSNAARNIHRQDSPRHQRGHRSR